MEISISQLGNRAVKEEFQILDLIFSELLFYIEKTFKKLDSFYKEIKDLNQQSKFYYLYNWLTNNHYSYDNNSKISDIFDYVFVYFKTKARWRSLLKAKNEILKLTESLKNEMKEQPIQVLPTDNVSNISIKDELQNLKVKIEDNNFNQQIISLCNQFSNENVKYAEESEISEYLKKSKSKNLFENEVSFSMNNEVPKDFSSSFISNYQRNITIIKGDSATGKTTLIELIREYGQEGEESGIQLSCKAECVVVEGQKWKDQLSAVKDSIVFIDETNKFIETQEFASAVKESTNYFVIITRESLEMLPVSVSEVYGIKSSGKYNSLEPVYHEMYEIYKSSFYSEPCSVCPNKIIVEDSNSGYEFFSHLSERNNLECISANGKYCL